MKKKEQTEWLSKISSIDYMTPCKITRRDILVSNALQLRELFPRIGIFYAVKSACEVEIIRTLDNVVDGYDIASLGEYSLLKELGIDSSRILYSNPVKIPEHIEKTHSGGVKYYAFDSLSEIKKLAENAPGANVYLRMKVSDYGSRFPLSKKFGVDDIHVVSFMDIARDFGLNPCGITFHVGSQSESPQTWEVAIESAGKAIKRLENIGIQIAFLNIGGGLPVEYVDRIPTMKQLARAINDSIDKNIPENVQIVAEPGRAISANASVIISSVIGKAHRSGDDWLYLDMGVFQGLMECLEIDEWRFPIFTERGNGSLPYSMPFVLTGPSCDAYDTIGLEYYLPPDIDVGDKVFIGKAGAYTTVYESYFNGFEPPKRYYIE